MTVVQFLSKNIALDENRRAASCPHLRGSYVSLNAFPKGFESYLNDRLFLRKQLVMWRNLLKLRVFSLSGDPRVLVGKNDFYFYAYPATINLGQPEHPFAPEQLIAWKELLEKRTAWCRERGIDYVFVLAPVKSSIYASFLPNEFAQHPLPARVDQLIEFLQKTNSPVKLLDLRKALTSLKDDRPLYLKTDTHWNQLGAYYGYRAVMDYLRLSHHSLGQPMPLSEFAISPHVFSTGDLVLFQGLFGVLDEINLQMERRMPSKAKRFNYNANDTRQPFYFQQKDTKLPSAVMFRDSFATIWADLFLPNHFSKISFYWQPEFSESIVSRERPNIVVQEQLESRLYAEIPNR
jgi:hypothetical protein